MLCVRPVVTSHRRVFIHAADGKVKKREGSHRGFKFKEVGKYIRRMASNYLSVGLFSITHANVSIGPYKRSYRHGAGRCHFLGANVDREAGCCTGGF